MSTTAGSIKQAANVATPRTAIGGPRTWLSAKQFRGFRVLVPFARRHRPQLIQGLLAAVLVVGLRLALPWPLRIVMEPSLSGEVGQLHDALAWLPVEGNPVIVMGLAFVILLVVLGFADSLERICFTRFAIGTVRDLRAEAFKALVRTDPSDRAVGSGDLVARLVGDTARIKAGLRGFLVHVATNGLMFAGVIAVLFFINVRLALVFAAAGLGILAVTTIGMARVRRAALKHRKKEGKLADSIALASGKNFDEAKFTKVNQSSGSHEASLMKLQGAVTWSTHAIFGLAVLFSLWIGTRSIAGGGMSNGDLFMFVAYALIVQRPTVQLARQGARTGQLLACAERVAKVLDAAHEGEDKQRKLKPLRESLELVDISLHRGKTPTGAPERMAGISMRFRPGERVLLVGAPGSGKTTLLEIMAGLVKPTHGKILWDERALTKFNSASRSQQISYLPHNPTWVRRRIGELLNLPSTVNGSTEELLVRCGVQRTIDRLPRGLQSKIKADTLSFGERQALALARILLGNTSLWLLDDFTTAMPNSDANDLIRLILGLEKGATIVVACQRPVAPECFDRVIELDDGRVIYDGPPVPNAANESARLGD